VLNFGDRSEPAFFEHMRRLHPQLQRMMAYSGITHAMVLKRAWLRELHEAVAAHHSGAPLWESYLECIDPAERERGASEAEIYFNFCLMSHARDVTIRGLDWVSTGDLAALAGKRPDYVSLARELRSGPIDRLQLQAQFASRTGSA